MASNNKKNVNESIKKEIDFGNFNQYLNPKSINESTLIAFNNIKKNWKSVKKKRRNFSFILFL